MSTSSLESEFSLIFNGSLCLPNTLEIMNMIEFMLGFMFVIALIMRVYLHFLRKREERWNHFVQILYHSAKSDAISPDTNDLEDAIRYNINFTRRFPRK